MILEKYLLAKDKIQQTEIDGYDITFFGIRKLSLQGADSSGILEEFQTHLLCTVRTL